MGKSRSYRRHKNWVERNGKYVALVLIGVVAAGTVAFALNRPLPAPSETRPSASATPTPTPTLEPIRVAAVGDSITEGNSPAFNEGRFGDGSWAFHALGEGTVFAGGWAAGGARTPEMLAGVAPVSADVLVVLAGTNDVGNGERFHVTSANIAAIVAKSTVPRVIVSAVPPTDANPQLAVKFNTQLQEFVTAQGWEWVDPMVGVRDGDVYGAGMTADGVHPTPQASALIGAAIREQILPD